jgi:hypothetical protein
VESLVGASVVIDVPSLVGRSVSLAVAPSSWGRHRPF